MKIKFYIPAAGFIILLFISAIPLYSSLIIDCEGLGYAQAEALAPGFSNLNVKAVMIGSPFKAYENKKRDMKAYDFFDTGDRMQRGSIETALGSASDFSNFVSFFHEKKIEVYCLVDLFRQKPGFKRDMWEASDFTPDSYASGDEYYIDINKAPAVKKFSGILSFITALPVDEWVADLRGMPQKNEKSYREYLLGNNKGKIIILSDSSLEYEFRMSSRDYNYLREKIFIMPLPKLNSVKSFQPHTAWLHLIGSDSLSVNNFAVMTYLVSQGENVVIPYNLLNSYGLDILSYFKDSPRFSVQAISDEKLVLYSQDKAAAFNFSGEFSFWKSLRISGIKNGSYKSVFGGEVLIQKEAETDFFMFPETEAVWDMEKPQAD